MCLLLQISSRNSLFEMLLWIHFFFNLLIINFTFYFIFVYFSDFRGSKNWGSMDPVHILMDPVHGPVHGGGPWTRGPWARGPCFVLSRQRQPWTAVRSCMRQTCMRLRVDWYPWSTLHCQVCWQPINILVGNQSRVISTYELVDTRLIIDRLLIKCQTSISPDVDRVSNKMSIEDVIQHLISTEDHTD